jgi:hypothetical protein
VSHCQEGKTEGAHTHTHTQREGKDWRRRIGITMRIIGRKCEAVGNKQTIYTQL